MITVYTKNNCMQCTMTKKWLEKNDVDFKEINIEDHPEAIVRLKELGFASAPVIEKDDFRFSGFQPEKLKQIV